MALLALVPYLALSTALSPLSPLISRDLSMSAQTLSLGLGLGNAGYALGTVLAVVFAQHLPQRVMLVSYAAVSVVGSVLLAAAQDPTMFIVGHVLQGLTTSLMLIAAVPPLALGFGAEKLRYTSVTMSICIFGAVALGPTVGGIQADAHQWRPLLWIVAVIAVLALVLTVPLGITCAAYLNETKNRGSQFVRTVVEAMTALPSVLAGLFIFATWILILGFGRSGLAAALAVSIMMLPIIIRASDVVLRLVPGNLREASAALGAPAWRTVWHVVLPTARSGLATSVILGTARGIGETSPVLLTAGFTSALNTNPLSGPMVSLPLAAFEFVRSPQPALVARGFATAAVLMVVVLVLFVIARIFGGRGPGHVSKGQGRRIASRSARDLARYEAAELARAGAPGFPGPAATGAP